jgi:lycopene beta-cyclase
MSISVAVPFLKPLKTYDYIFAGYGAAASLLILQLHNKNLLGKLNILIVDPERKNKNDKTFCFWANKDEDIVQDLKHLIKHSWSNVLIQNAGNTPLAPLTYHHISSIDLYDELLKLEKSYNWDRLISPVDKVSSDENGAYIVAKGEIIRGNKVFDSRTPIYEKTKAGETHIFQSFVGWEIETSRLIENPDTCRLMDFDVEQKGSTQFMYVLPFSPTTALVELTRFGSEILCETAAEKQLQDYIHKHFGEFKKQAIEIGCIPMSNAEIKNDTLKDVVLLGARNYKVKPSTGYAFKNMYHHASELVNSISNLKNSKELNVEHAKAPTGRFAFYDSLLLHILKNKPQNGKIIFQDLLKGVEINTVLRFLDEKTSFYEDLKIFAKLPWSPFLKAVYIFLKKYNYLRYIIAFLAVVIYWVFDYFTLLSPLIMALILIPGFLYVGIPHGALDHILIARKEKTLLKFCFKYILIMGIYFIVWQFFPLLSLLFFILFSAFHFGESELEEGGWNISSLFLYTKAFVFGLCILLFIIFTHHTESQEIISLFNVNFTQSLRIFDISIYAVWIASISFLYILIQSILSKKYAHFGLLFLLVLGIKTPLILAFGLYFIFQHSLNAWGHLQHGLKMDGFSLYKKALPFTISAIFFLCAMLFYNSVAVLNPNEFIATLFIFLSCISLPHFLLMHLFYKVKQ